MTRTVVATEALWRLVERAGRDPDPDLRAAAHALLRSGTNPAPPRRSHLSPDEAAGLLGVSLTTVYRWCRNGTIPAERFGQLWRIPTSALANGDQPPPTVATEVADTGPVSDGDPHDQEQT